jgi:hypothetical protein
MSHGAELREAPDVHGGKGQNVTSVTAKSTILAAIGMLSVLAAPVAAAPTSRDGSATTNDGSSRSEPTMVVDRGTFCFATGDHPALHAGKMRLATPHADVAVIGTRFILEVNDDFTRVTVLEGRVELTPHAGSKVTPVIPGQAATATSTDVDVRFSAGQVPDVLPPGNCD